MPIVPDIMKLASIRPEFLRVLHDGYRAMFVGGYLPRQVKEMIATVVSRTNSCQY
jgi:alkylhydroperoxidase family enzyme